MGRFKAGDRVKILAGHPYHAGRDSQGEEMTGVVKNDEGKVDGRRGKYLVEVDGGWLDNYSFKGRELELIVDVAEPIPVEGPDAVAASVPVAAPWVPKVGDRVRVKDSAGGGKVGDECVVTDVTEYGDGSDAYCRLDGLSDGAEGLYSYRLDPLPIAEPTPIVTPTAEVNVGDRVWDVRRNGDKCNEATVSAVRTDGKFTVNWDDGDVGEHWWSLKAWDGHAPAPAPQPADPQAKFNVGDRVKSSGNHRWEYIVAAVHDDALDVSVIEEDGSEGITFHGTHISKFSLVDPTVAKATPAPTGSFIVARLTATGEPRPNVRPRVHASIEAAEAEAQRLADRLGDEFAVYQRVSSKTVDAGPVPEDLDLEQARLTATHKGAVQSAFVWARTKQGHGFWRDQRNTGLTHLGRAILKKWIAEAEATTKEAA